MLTVNVERRPAVKANDVQTELSERSLHQAPVRIHAAVSAAPNSPGLPTVAGWEQAGQLQWLMTRWEREGAPAMTSSELCLRAAVARSGRPSLRRMAV